MYLFAADCRFFMALTFCTILVSWVADLSEQAEESGWLVPSIVYLWGADSGIYLFLVQEGVPQR